MDPVHLKWILENGFNFTKESRPTFLKTLKKEPEKVKAYIQDNILDWPAVACFKLGQAFAIANFDTAAQEVLEAVQKQFAAELEALPAST